MIPAVCLLAIGGAVLQAGGPSVVRSALSLQPSARSFSEEPQWITSSRLLRPGETIEFRFHLPSGAQGDRLEVFPRYLERAKPGANFILGAEPKWLDELKPEQIRLEFANGQASRVYRPRRPGSYLARWRVGKGVFYRYFAAIEDDWVVIRLSTFANLESEPTLHATGIPLDYRLPVERFDAGDPLFQKLLGYHRRHGEQVIPHFPDTGGSTEERVRQFAPAMDKARSLLPDPSDTRSARLELYYRTRDLDPGYTQTLMALGVNDHDGLNEANCTPWRGMPEFPYFSSPLDCRKPNQEPGGQVVAHQWDFCGGWHFLGPVSWHYSAAEGDWPTALRCLRQGLEEARNAAVMSGHPIFLHILYDGLQAWLPSLDFRGANEQEHLEFIGRYQRALAFDFPKRYHLAFARSIDIADYYRRHFETTPSTVFVSRTDHVQYDKWWLIRWGMEKQLIPRERIPWWTRMSTLHKDKETMQFPGKDPLSYEYIVVEGQQRYLRFERECPHPIWYYDYTQQKQDLEPEGSTIHYVTTPDVEVVRSGWQRTDDGLTMHLKMLTEATFPDYPICLWGLPVRNLSPEAVKTNASRFLPARNIDGEQHLILFFDLKPEAEIDVTLQP